MVRCAPQGVYQGLSNKDVTICVNGRVSKVNLDSEYHPEVITDRAGDVRAHKPSNGSVARIGAGIAESVTYSITKHIENTLDQRLYSMFAGGTRSPEAPPLHEIVRNLIHDEVRQISQNVLGTNLCRYLSFKSRFLGIKIKTES